MQIVWDNLLPEMKGAAPLPKDRAAYNKLKNELSTLAYEPPKLATSSPIAAAVTGKEYMLEQNPFEAKAVSFKFANNTCIFTLKTEGKPVITITGGINTWIRKGNLKPEPHSLFSLRRIDFDSIVAASATWVDDKTLLLTWRFIETVHGDSVTCAFEGDTVTLKFLFSVNRLNKTPDDRADIKGKIAG